MNPLFDAALARHGKDAKVLVCGDWHGNGVWARAKVEQAKELGCSLILHVGDFGIWSNNNGKKYLHKLNKACEEADVDIFVTLGNHEDHARVNNLWSHKKGLDEQGQKPVPLSLNTERIFILPRPYRFALNGINFGSFGGAASVDFDVRTPYRDWWPEEMFTQREIDEAIQWENIDVLLQHETPEIPYAVPSVGRILNSNPLGFSQAGLNYSRQSRAVVTTILEAVKPKLVFHGHMHVSGVGKVYIRSSAHATTVVSLDMDLTNGNVHVLDLEQFHETYF